MNIRLEDQELNEAYQEYISCVEGDIVANPPEQYPLFCEEVRSPDHPFSELSYQEYMGVVNAN